MKTPKDIAALLPVEQFHPRPPRAQVARLQMWLLAALVYSIGMTVAFAAVCALR